MTNQIDARFVPPVMKPMMGLMKLFGAFGDTAKAAKSAVYAATSDEIKGKSRVYISPGPKTGKASGYIYKREWQEKNLSMTKRIMANLVK